MYVTCESKLQFRHGEGHPCVLGCCVIETERRISGGAMESTPSANQRHMIGGNLALCPEDNVPQTLLHVV